MKNEIMIFESPEFGRIRTVNDEKGEPWFIGKDVAIILGYSNVRDAIYKHVDREDKGVANCDSLGGRQKTTIINESDSTRSSSSLSCQGHESLSDG